MRQAPELTGDRRRRPKFWTPARIFELAGYLELGWSDERIGQRMGTTANAVNLARKRHGIRPRSVQLLTARTIARMLGISCSKAVSWWIRSGWLRGRRGERFGLYRMWYVRHEDLEAFLEDPSYWHLWQPERIPDRALREWYQAARTEQYLTLSEVAARCYVMPKTVYQWIQKGKLPAVRRGNHLIPASALVGFVPPGQRSRVGTRRSWREEDDARLLALRAAGMTQVEVGRELGRSRRAIQAREGRLRGRKV